MGVEVEEYDDAVRVKYIGEVNGINVKTLPYPGFPTDMNPQMGVLMCIANGKSTMREGVWDNRFKYCDELYKMGAAIKVSDGKMAEFLGGANLKGAQISACDLRAGAAFIIAGLAADGVTEIDNIRHIQRGYEDICGKLRKVGADIEMVTE
jgi:UDP-N-acetylglucosamine 1-carboxyvinyltransferase